MQDHKQQKGLGLQRDSAVQRDYELGESSWDQQEGASEEDWVSPTPDKGHTQQNNDWESPPGGTRSQTITGQVCMSSSLRHEES